MKRIFSYALFGLAFAALPAALGGCPIYSEDRGNRVCHTSAPPSATWIGLIANRLPAPGWQAPHVRGRFRLLTVDFGSEDGSIL